MAFQDNNLVLGKLRFDTSALDQQMKTITERLNEMKRVAAEAKKYGASGGSSGGSGGKRTTNADTVAIKQVTDLLKRQQLARKELAKATEAQSAQAMKYWAQEEAAAKRQIDNTTKSINRLKVEEETRDRIRQLVKDSRMNDKVEASANELKQKNAALKEQADVFGKIAEMSKIAQKSMAEMNKQNEKEQT